MIKKTALLLFLILLSSQVFCLTIKSDSFSYEKGSEISLNGICDQGKLHKIKAQANNKSVFEEQINCFDNQFEYTYKTTFLDPSGNWKIILFTEENSTVLNQVEINTRLDPIAESAYYRITFLSPAGLSFSRSEIIPISIEVTDSGEPVDGAQVIFFDVFGRKIDLKEEGNGIYDLNYSIPFDAPAGDWGLTVLAQKNADEKIFGGERTIDLKITNALFDVEIIEPSKQNYEQSDPIPIKLNITYANGIKLSPEKIESADLLVGGEVIPMEFNSDSDLFLSYQPHASGNTSMIISVVDVVGNKLDYPVNVVVTCSSTCWLKNYGLIVLVVALLAAILIRLFYAKVKYSFLLSSLKNEKEKTMMLIKNLQSEYFEKGVMPASSYKKNLAEYKAHLIETEEKLKQMKKMIEEEK